MEDLIQEYNELTLQVQLKLQQISNYKDGYKYLARYAIWQGYNNKIYNNQFTILNEANEFNGDNGLVELFTTNPNINESIKTYHEFKVVSKKEFNKLIKLDYNTY